MRSDIFRRGICLNEFFDNFLAGQNVDKADAVDFHEYFTEEIGGVSHPVNEAVGQAEAGCL